MNFFTQPSESSFRFEDSTPDSLVPTFVPKKEPLWLSVILDCRDLARCIIDPYFRKNIPQ